MLRSKNIHLIEFLCSHRSVFKHCTHCGVTVNVCIFTLNVVILSRFKGQILINLHKLCVHFTNSCTLCSVKNKFLCSSCVSAVNKNLFNGILNVFNGRSFISVLLFKILAYFISQLLCRFIVCSANSLCGFKNSLCDFFKVKINRTSVTLNDFCNH